MNVLYVLDKTNFIYFVSDKSSIYEVARYFFDKYEVGPFKNAEVRKIKNYTSWNTGYTDIMVYKNNFDR